MPCHPLPEGGFACSRGRRSEPCQEPGCTEVHVALCDWPLDGAAKGRTCDRRMCARHRNKVGPNRDYCGPHYREATARQQALPVGGGR